MIWSSFLISGVGDLVTIIRIMNGFILQHDNNLKHTANAVKANLEGKTHNETVSVMDWL